ncbi:MAG TPA: hypothetical protein VGL81_24795 [Polyangiaceae bacterium]|jgi:hypothetical protein
MSEANADFLDSGLLNDAEATNQRPALSPDGEELKTTRLPSMTPPPPPLPTASLPPLPPVTFPPAAPAPSFAIDTGTTRYRSEPPPAGPKPSWLQALLTTTFPPPAAQRHAGPHAPVSMQTAGTVFAVMGLIFAVVALVTGLRGVPSDSAVAPVVTAAYVIARALVALGAGALSFAMFRQAERLLVQEPPKG